MLSFTVVPPLHCWGAGLRAGGASKCLLGLDTLSVVVEAAWAVFVFLFLSSVDFLAGMSHWTSSSERLDAFWMDPLVSSIISAPRKVLRRGKGKREYRERGRRDCENRKNEKRDVKIIKTKRDMTN